MTLLDVVHLKDKEYMRLLNTMTSEACNGIKKLRQAYLSNEKKLDAKEEMNLLETMSRRERIIVFMGDVGREFAKNIIELVLKKVYLHDAN